MHQNLQSYTTQTCHVLRSSFASLSTMHLIYQFLLNFPFILCDLEARIGTWEAVLSFSILLSFSFLFPPLSVKLLYWLLLPFLLPSDFPTFEFLSLECLLLLANLSSPLLVDLTDSFLLGKSDSNFFSLFLFLCLTKALSWVSELSGFLDSSLQGKKKREERTLIQLPRNNTLAYKFFHKQLNHTPWQMNLQAHFLYH